MRIRLLLLSSVLFLNNAYAADYEIDSTHANASFSIRHLMVSNVKGDFANIAGKISYDEKSPEKSLVEATVEINTIDTKNQKRDEHLKGGDFFDAAKFPLMTFKSKKVEKAGEGKLKAIGDLTIRGVTKEVALDIEGPSAEIKDPWGNVKRGASATTTINRKDFGLTWNKALETGGVAVGEEVKVVIDLEMTKK
ncbi:MAG: polyisoprenoid-binding protein [Proteobacteria bacterium]|nr:polyisoprenoid-binding protein [Pseudomonadota bacterium]